MADPAVAAAAALAQGRTSGDLFRRPWVESPYDPDAGRWDSIKRNSVLSGITPWSQDRRYRDVFGDEKITPQAKVAYVAGRLGRDFLSDGTRLFWWLGGHPLGATSVVGDIASDAAGFRATKAEIQDIKAQLDARGETSTREAALNEWSNKNGFAGSDNPNGIPAEAAAAILPLAASLSLVGASGTHDLSNIAGGGRTPGYEALFHDEGTPAETNNPVGEAGARYFFGRSGRLLPWEEFTAERPEVNPIDYEAAKAQQFDRGPLGLGLFRATDRNLTGEPEFTMMGFQVPLSGAASAGGALIGGVAGARELDALIKRRYADRLQEVPENLALLRTTAGRRVAGAALGALAGAISGRLGATAINDIAIQPLLNPEAVANQRAWEQQQEALGLI